MLVVLDLKGPASGDDGSKERYKAMVIAAKKMKQGQLQKECEQGWLVKEARKNWWLTSYSLRRRIQVGTWCSW